MARKRYSSEQIIGMLREAEVLLNKGSSVIEVSRQPLPRIVNLREAGVVVYVIV